MARAHRNTTATKFPSRVARISKSELGRTDATATPLHVRTLGTLVDGPTRLWIQDRAARRLGKYASHIERISFRFDDVNGPRGGKDIVCKGKVVLSGMPSSVVEKRARSAREAFDMVSRQLERGLGKSVSQLVEHPRARSVTRKAARVTATKVSKVTKPRVRTATTRSATRRVTTPLEVEDSVTGRTGRSSPRKARKSSSISGTELGKKTRHTVQSPKRRATRARHA